MVDRSEQLQWAQAEVERLDVNLAHLKSLNATPIGIQLAEEELAKARAALAELEGPAPVAEELTLAEDVVLADEPVAETSAPEPEVAAEPPMLEVVDGSVAEEPAADVSVGGEKDVDASED